MGEVIGTRKERTVGMVIDRRAVKEKNIVVKCSAGQGATMNHLAGSASQETFLVALESTECGIGLSAIASSLPCAHTAGNIKVSCCQSAVDRPHDQ